MLTPTCFPPFSPTRIAEGSLPRASYVIPSRSLVILSYTVLLLIAVETVRGACVCGLCSLPALNHPLTFPLPSITGHRLQPGQPA